MYSADGITWSPATEAQTNAWQSVTYGNGLFVAVSSNGTNRVMTSPDGIIWTSRSIEANQWSGIVYVPYGAGGGAGGGFGGSDNHAEIGKPGDSEGFFSGRGAAATTTAGDFGGGGSAVNTAGADGLILLVY
jgi:hypothetical protein